MLYKSVIRYFKRHLFQVALLMMIMIMSAFIFVVMRYSLRALKEPAEAYFDTYRQEDFNVTLFQQILPFDLESVSALQMTDAVTLSDLYQYDQDIFFDVMRHRSLAFESRFTETKIEPRLYKDVYYPYGDEQHRMRVLKDAHMINLSFVTSGRKPEAAFEIALVEVYATGNDLSIGDSIFIHDQSYVITGFVLFPDYTLPIFGSEFILNNQTRTLGLMSDASFDSLHEPLGVVFAGIFLSSLQPSFYFSQHQLPFVLNISLTFHTLRSGAIYDEITGAEAMSLLMSLMIASIAVIMVAIMVSRMLSEQRGAIGILKALGYRNREIAVPYLVFVLMLALPGLLVGYVFGYYLAQPMTDLYASIYLLPSQPVEPSVLVFAQSIATPLILLMILGYLVINRLLKTHPIDLMRSPITKMDHVSKGVKALSRLPLIKRIRHAYILRHKSRFMVFSTGVFTAVLLILLAFSMVNIFDKMFKDYYDSIDVTFFAYCETNVLCEPTNTSFDKALEIPYVMMEDKSVTVIGLDSDNRLHPLFENGKDITHLLAEEGIIITRGIAMETRIKKGDKVSLSYGGVEFTATVLGIQDEIGASKVYLDRQTLSEHVSYGFFHDLHNVIYADTFPEGSFLTIIDTEELMRQSEYLSNMMIVMSSVMTVSAVFIGVIVLLMVIVLSIEQYTYDISLFRVIGFDHREIKSIFISGYRVYMVLIYLITLPVAWFGFEWLMGYMAAQYSMIFPMTLSPAQILISLVITVGMFYLAVPVVYRKISSMTLAEAIKIYQSAS